MGQILRRLSACRGVVPPVFLLAVLAGATLPVSARAEGSSTAAQVAFTFGVLAWNQGEDEEAVRQFEEAVRNNPKDGTYLHWLGLAELRAGHFAEAVARLEESLGAEIPPAAGEARVRADLRVARQTLQPGGGGSVAIPPPEYEPEALLVSRLPRWSGRLGLQTARDSNPELMENDQQPLLVPGSVGADTAALLDVQIEHHPFQHWQGWSLGISLEGHQSFHQDLSDVDLALVKGAVSAVLGADPQGFLDGPLGIARVPSGGGRFALMLQGGGYYAWLGRKSFLRTGEAAVSVLVREVPWTSTRLWILGGDRSFGDSDALLLRRSGEELSAGVDQYFHLGRLDRRLRLGLATGKDRTDARLFERSFDEASAELTMLLSSRWTVNLLGIVRDDDYADPTSNFTHQSGPRRADTTRQLAATALWRATDQFGWTLRASHGSRSSNVDFPPGLPLLDYQKTVIALGIEWLF